MEFVLGTRYDPGACSQSDKAIAIGYNDGYTNQGANAIAIGSYAGVTNQHSNSIVINADNTKLNSEGISTQGVSEPCLAICLAKYDV